MTDPGLLAISAPPGISALTFRATGSIRLDEFSVQQARFAVFAPSGAPHGAEGSPRRLRIPRRSRNTAVFGSPSLSIFLSADSER